jgi:hypothetical protein
MLFMKSFLFSFFLILSSSFLFAQDSLQQQAIYLIDGSVLKATILERTTEFTRIKIISGDVLLLNNNLITHISDKVVISFSAPAIGPPPPPRRSALQESGWYHIVSMGLLLGRDAASEEGLIASFSPLHYVTGYQFNQYFGAGLGAGIDLYDPAFFPIYADFRGNLDWLNQTFFYSLQSGYSLSEDDIAKRSDSPEYEGGWMIYPVIGMRFPTRGKTDILLELGYRQQWTKITYPWNEDVDKLQYRRYALRVGFSF